MIFNGVNDDMKKELLLLAGVGEGSFPMTYIGVPLKPNKWSKEDCSKIVDKIRRGNETLVLC